MLMLVFYVADINLSFYVVLLAVHSFISYLRLFLSSVLLILLSFICDIFCICTAFCDVSHWLVACTLVLCFTTSATVVLVNVFVYMCVFVSYYSVFLNCAV